MRKVGEQETIVAVLEVTIIGTAEARVTFDSRILVQDSGR